jgi:hypothetical protein
MKLKVFYGTMDEAVESFNKWAKGKKLTREVIIHTLAFPTPDTNVPDYFAIMVFHPEDPEWDKTEA